MARYENGELHLRCDEVDAASLLDLFDRFARTRVRIGRPLNEPEDVRRLLARLLASDKPDVNEEAAMLAIMLNLRAQDAEDCRAHIAECAEEKRQRWKDVTHGTV